MHPEPPENPLPVTPDAVPPANRRHVPCLLQSVVVCVVVGMAASVCLPVFNTTAVRGVQTMSLAKAKQIGLALRLFAQDHDDRYPAAGVPVEMTQAPTNSNVAFACLFPTYTTSEKTFGNPTSAYQTHPPDDITDNPPVFPPVKTLEPGENVYGYVMGLTEKSSPGSPIVVDGTDGTGHYRADPKALGGIWKGERAIVIHLDNSGAVEALQGPPTARFIPVPGHPTQNLLDPASLGEGVRLLDPAVAGH